MTSTVRKISLALAFICSASACTPRFGDCTTAANCCDGGWCSNNFKKCFPAKQNGEACSTLQKCDDYLTCDSTRRCVPDWSGVAFLRPQATGSCNSQFNCGDDEYCSASGCVNLPNFMEYCTEEIGCNNPAGVQDPLVCFEYRCISESLLKQPTTAPSTNSPTGSPTQRPTPAPTPPPTFDPTGSPTNEPTPPTPAPPPTFNRCPDLIADVNGAITYTGLPGRLGSVAIFSCDAGYLLTQGQTVLECESSTGGLEWSNPAPICVPYDPKPICADDDDWRSYDNKRCYQFAPNFLDNFLLCDQYEASIHCPLTCQKCSTNCDLLYPPENGYIEDNKNFPGDVVTLSCNEGYTPSAPFVLTCTFNGWDTFEPVCQKIGLCRDREPEDTFDEGKSCADVNTTGVEIDEVACADFNYIKQCPKACLACKQECEPFPPLAFGFIEETARTDPVGLYPAGTSIRVRCGEGRVLVGSDPEANCLGLLVWDRDPNWECVQDADAVPTLANVTGPLEECVDNAHVYDDGSTVPGYVPYVSTKIIGGETTAVREFPSFAVLAVEGDDGSLRAVCGGSLIGPTFVLTAAHCGVHSITHAVIGAHRMDPDTRNLIITDDDCVEVIEIENFIQHPDNDGFSFEHDDIAVVSLAENSTYPWVRLNLDAVQEQQYKKAIAVGLGAREKGVLSPADFPGAMESVEMLIDEQDYCETLMQALENPFPLLSTMICAGDPLTAGKDACVGDSGGPLLSSEDGSLVGIVSWGYAKGCGLYPSAYTRVRKYAVWVCQATGGAICF